MNLTIDSWAWVELLEGTEMGRKVRQQIEQADFCVCPALVLAELAAFGRRKGRPDAQVLQDLAQVGVFTYVIPTDPALAVEGARAADELRSRARSRKSPLPGLGDGVVLATARRFGTRVATGDAHFEGLSETLWVPGLP
ncbi:MAG: PIN domain-containing protein [Euryarchaeota archaeon]|nr:PIN domain-containing protein [Euryarchaeota archaeon]MDE2044955.1 PIN domain-containing protein [Thermoplasmata archaeon]